MDNNLNSFFDSATPAEINGLVESPQRQELEAQAPEEEPTAPSQVLPTAQPAQSSSAFTEPSADQETPQQMNFRKMREDKLRAEWERDELQRRLAAFETSKTQPQQQPEEEDEDLGIGSDDIIEGKHLTKVIKKIEQKVERKFQKQLQQQHQQTQLQLIESRLKLELPDIDNVVNQDSLRMLQTKYPELAQTLNSNQDLYSKAKSAYTLIRELNISPSGSRMDNQRIQQNLAKPRPVQSVVPRQSALAEAQNYDTNLTDDMKKQLWKEMQQAITRG